MTDFAFVTLTMVAAVYTVVRHGCGRRLLDWPTEGMQYVEARTLDDIAQRSGRGPTLVCPRCHALVEVVEHAA